MHSRFTKTKPATTLIDKSQNYLIEKQPPNVIIFHNLTQGTHKIVPGHHADHFMRTYTQTKARHSNGRLGNINHNQMLARLYSRIDYK